MKKLARSLSRNEGLSLIEMLVVVAILGILASLTAVAVTGTTSSSKTVTKEGDENTVTKAVARYSSEHPEERYPTLDGCLAGETLNLTSLTCGSGIGEQEFNVDETALSVDVDLDGLTTSTSVKVVPITWEQYFEIGSQSKTFDGDFVKVPGHGFETRVGDSFRTATGDRTEDTTTSITGVPDIATSCSVPGGSSGDCPVWVINEFGDAIALLPGSSY